MKSTLALVFMLFAGCAVAPAEEATGGAGTGGQSTQPDDSIYLMRGCPTSGDLYNLEDASLLTDGRLAVNVSYSGGCEEHVFTACWSGDVYKSLPPQADIKIYHDGGGDQCRALIEEEIYIDTNGAFDILHVSRLQLEGVRVAVELP